MLPRYKIQIVAIVKSYETDKYKSLDSPIQSHDCHSRYNRAKKNQYPSNENNYSTIQTE